MKLFRTFSMTNLCVDGYQKRDTAFQRWSRYHQFTMLSHAWGKAKPVIICFGPPVIHWFMAEASKVKNPEGMW